MLPLLLGIHGIAREGGRQSRERDPDTVKELETTDDFLQALLALGCVHTGLAAYTEKTYVSIHAHHPWLYPGCLPADWHRA